jgi:nucleotide-binding universal stress UspA family protein
MAETVVVGVDGTADSLEALRAVADMAEESGASLVVVYVRHESPLVAESLGRGGAEALTLEALDEEQKSSQDRAAAALAGRELDWRFEVASGDPATELIATARRHRASTITVGGRSHGLIGGLVLGSVAQKLVRHSPVSTLVVRDGRAHDLDAASAAQAV